MAKSNNNRQRRGSGGHGEVAVRFTSGGRQLSRAERETIERRLNEDRAYMDHPSFSEGNSQGVPLGKALVSAEVGSKT